MRKNIMRGIKCRKIIEPINNRHSHTQYQRVRRANQQPQWHQNQHRRTYKRNYLKRIQTNPCWVSNPQKKDQQTKHPHYNPYNYHPSQTATHSPNSIPIPPYNHNPTYNHNHSHSHRWTVGRCDTS